MPKLPGVDHLDAVQALTKAGFWDTHSITDYEELLEPVDLDANIQPRRFEMDKKAPDPFFGFAIYFLSNSSLGFMNS